VSIQKKTKEGLTKRITLGNVTFRDDQKNIIKHSDPDLENKAKKKKNSILKLPTKE
jgi:hypothetical protein